MHISAKERVDPAPEPFPARKPQFSVESLFICEARRFGADEWSVVLTGPAREEVHIGSGIRPGEHIGQDSGVLIPRRCRDLDGIVTVARVRTSGSVKVDPSSTALVNVISARRAS